MYVANAIAFLSSLVSLIILRLDEYFPKNSGNFGKANSFPASSHGIIAASKLNFFLHVNYP